ncbi:transposable element Tcb1 transposase [Trichonephila clavipes]|nr:transposable element Tcb1 transposase [Trichonephila clavipes]
METPWRENAEQLRYAPPHWSCTEYYDMGWYWISLSHSSSTHCRYFKQPALHFRGVGASCPSLPSGLSAAIFQQDNARLHVARIVQRFFVNHQIELLPWPARSPDLSPIENMWSVVAQRLNQITTPAATPDNFWQRVEASWSAVPQEHIQGVFESMPRRVAAVISNNGSYSGY